MNHKLISELALKSYIVVGDYSYCQNVLSPKKFAELVVKECIEVINDNVEVALSATGNVVFEDELLKNHFGIKDESKD